MRERLKRSILRAGFQNDCLNSSFWCIICNYTVPQYYLRPMSDCLNCEFKFLVCYIITTVPLYYLHPMLPPKRLASSPASGKEHKRQKKVMTVHEKVELLDREKEGKSYAAVERHYGVNASTVRYIKTNEKAIRSSVASIFFVRMVNVVRNKAIIRMEFALTFWIQDLRKKNIPLDTNS